MTQMNIAGPYMHKIELLFISSDSKYLNVCRAMYNGIQ